MILCLWFCYYVVCLFCYLSMCLIFFFYDAAATVIYTLSLHDALPILVRGGHGPSRRLPERRADRLARGGMRSEEHTSELQSRFDLVCRLLLEKKKKFITTPFKVIINLTYLIIFIS